MPSEEIDAAVAALARHQHGAWSRRQAAGVGATRSMIESRVRTARWVRLDNAVYGHPASPPTWERSVMAAVLAESWAVASHRTGDAVRDRYVELAPRGGRDLRPLRAALERFGSGDLPDPSALERVLRQVLTVPEIPAIEWEAPFPGRRPGKQRVDGFLRAWSMVVEGDGRAWHTRVEDFERDRRRDAEAAAAGLVTLRFTWYQLNDEPGWVRDVVTRSGAHRRAA